MAKSKGDCCIARWGKGYEASSYNTSKMDMIMLKFRPIAPKPVAGTENVPATVSGTSEGCSGSGEGHHVIKGVGVGRGRKKKTSPRKEISSSTRKCINKKRKSSSPNNDNNNNNNNNNQKHDYYYHKSDITVLPLFPEEPDLSPTSSSQSEVQNMVPCWFKLFDDNSLSFEDNYSNSNCGNQAKRKIRIE